MTSTRPCRLPIGRSPTSAFLLVVDVADDVGDVLVALLLLLDEGGVVHALVFELDLLFLGPLGRLGLARLLALGLRVRLLERHELGVGDLRCHHLFFRRGRRRGSACGRRRVRPRARAHRDDLHDRVTFRANDRILAEIVEFRAAIGAETFGAELGFRHGPGSLSGSKIEVLHLASRNASVNSVWGRSGARFDRLPRRLFRPDDASPGPCYSTPPSRRDLPVDHAAPSPLTARRAGALKGRVRVPGDKSISHRALIFGALTVGETRISGLLEGEDVINTAKAMRALGATIERTGEGTWRVHGVGVGGFREPDGVLDFGNSATGCRLVMGAVAGCPITATFDGDASLRKRPMRRILDPVTLIGAHAVRVSDGGRLPLTLVGARDPIPVVYRTPVPSAQIKSAVLLAALAAPGETTVIESEASRDHTEKMLAHFGAEVRIEAEGTHGRKITVRGEPELAPAPVVVPADPSSAAFPM